MVILMEFENLGFLRYSRRAQLLASSKPPLFFPPLLPQFHSLACCLDVLDVDRGLVDRQLDKCEIEEEFWPHPEASKEVFLL